MEENGNIDRSTPASNYRKLVNDSHSAFVIAVRWYENEDSTEPWREMLFLDIRSAIADWGLALRRGECRIELIDVCRCLDVYDQAVHNHRNFLKRLSLEKQKYESMKLRQNEQQSEKVAAEALMSVGGGT